jgi:hypothetical protein
MRFSPEQDESRREFFRAGARYGRLGLLVAATGMAARKQKPGSQRCINRGICPGCGAFGACQLPAALSARQAREETHE